MVEQQRPDGIDRKGSSVPFDQDLGADMTEDQQQEFIARIGRNATRADRRAAGEEEVSEDEDPLSPVKKGKGKAVATPAGLQSPLQLRKSLSAPLGEGLGKSSNPIDLDSEEVELRTPLDGMGRCHLDVNTA